MSANQITLPTPGQRIGVVGGPGQYASHNAGIVLCHVTNRWGTQALVLMDTGVVKKCTGLNRGPGIGWHAI